MPRYDFRCFRCNETTEHTVGMDEYTLYCEGCGEPMKRLITTSVMISGDMKPYYDKIIGKRWVDGRKDRRELLKSRDMTTD